jgi:hypothetical protein
MGSLKQFEKRINRDNFGRESEVFQAVLLVHERQNQGDDEEQTP